MPVVLPEAPDPSYAGRHRARSRLVALTAADQPAGPVAEPPHPVAEPLADAVSVRGESPAHRRVPDRDIEPDRPGPDGASPLGSSQRLGRLVRRWTPEPLRGARWDPGRPGAVTLSAVAALAAVMAAVGVWSDRPVAEPVPALPVLPAATATAAPPPPAPGTPAGQLVVSVLGRVAAPGLVRVPDGSRVADALDAAGGALPGTDLSPLNLARRLADGEQLLVGIAPPPGQPIDAGAAGAPVPATGAGGSGLVDLNTATLEQLDTLPGVGPVTAQRILDWRAANGRFTSVGQLREVDGIGEVRFAKLKDRVRV